MSRRNADYAWDRFNPDAYVELNYHQPRGDDRWLTARLGVFYAGLPEGLSVVDVGTGPNLITLLAALGRAHRVTAWEYSAANIDWLKSTIGGSAELPAPWRSFWDDLTATAPDVYARLEPTEGLKSRVDLVQGSLFDLPEGRWDAATMFFVAESVTGDLEEFRTACRCFARAAKPGGALAAAFMEHSVGYHAGTEAFPAVSISVGDIAAAFEDHISSISISRVPANGPMVREGYEGMLFMTATVRQQKAGDQP